MNVRPCQLPACAVLLIGLMGAAASQAQIDDEANVSYAFADVLSAEPWYETVEVVRPVERCRDRRVVRGGREPDGTGALVGAVVGGAAGSQVGGGNGRRAATVAGAIIGGLVGAQAERRNAREPQVSRETDCELVDERVSEEQIAGYEVQYRYRGEIYVSRLSHDPGDKLRIRIVVSPVEE